MNIKNLIVPLFIGLLCATEASAQAFGYQFTKAGAKQVKLKFEQINNLIILPITLNDTFQLYFIVDTGVRNTILTKRSYTDSLSTVHYGKKYRLTGADKSSFVEAQLVHGLKLDFGGVEALRQTALVLDDDYFALDKAMGRPIDGILGMDLFMRYTVKIDYQTSVMTLIEPEKFKSPRNFNTLDVELVAGKPYISVETIQQNGVIMTNKMLIDCGASLSMMLDVNTDSRIQLPEQHIQGTFGQVLGGNLEAYLGRVFLLNVGDFAFKNVVTNFQMPFWLDTNSTSHGLIGGGILSRFYVIFDFPHDKMYLKPSEKFDAPFVQDRSGLHVQLQGNNFNQFIIADVIAGSPADMAGIQTGDLILRCNGRPIERLTLSDISTTLQKEPDTLVQLTLLRNGEEVNVKFRLRDMI